MWIAAENSSFPPVNKSSTNRCNSKTNPSAADPAGRSIAGSREPTRKLGPPVPPAELKPRCPLPPDRVGPCSVARAFKPPKVAGSGLWIAPASELPRADNRSLGQRLKTPPGTALRNRAWRPRCLAPQDLQLTTVCSQNPKLPFRSGIGLTPMSATTSPSALSVSAHEMTES